MKLTTTTLFALFLLSALTSLLPSTTAQTVFDTDGNPVRNGGTYYITTYIRPGFSGIIGPGGGIERARTGNEICPLTVVQSPTLFYKGLPIRISSLLNIAIISEGIRLNLSFANPPSCSPTPKGQWTIVKGELEGQLSVKLDGYEDTVPGWFYIKKYETYWGGHKLVFCPAPIGIAGVLCADIGIYIDSEGNRRLVLTRENNPLVVQFEIATSSAAA